jgi:hypothetical protein
MWNEPKAESEPITGKSVYAGYVLRTPLHPLINELINLLPPSGSEWEAKDKRLWLLTLDSIFELVYNKKEKN